MPRLSWLVSAVALALALASCSDPIREQPVSGASRGAAGPTAPSPGPATTRSTPPQRGETTPATPPTRTPDSPSSATVTLGFAGDVHFEGNLSARLRRPAMALRPIALALRQPDLMMVNLETAITGRGSPEPKEYHFRTAPQALEALDAAGVDVVTMANNHAVDYGPLGLHDTLAAVRRSPIGVVGIGADAAAAFSPYEVSVRGVRVAVIAATTLPDRTALAWAAGPNQPGVAVAFLPRPRLVQAVRTASARADVVVVYLHWGEENQSCPYWRPLLHARALAAAGADVVVGSHAHVLLGAGWLDDTYVDYGLGNFIWYNQSSISTGILTLTIRNGQVVGDTFAPANIHGDGLPRMLTGRERADAVASWRQLRGCTDLAAERSG